MNKRNTIILCKAMSARRSAFAAFCLSLLAAGIGILAAEDAKPAQAIQPTPKLCEALRGSFDMAKSPRPWIGFMVMDQEGNRLPSFWCGGNAGGTVVFAGKVDDLDETFSLHQTGSFRVDLVHTARKHGMFDELPGGAWMQGGIVNPIKVTFERFTDPTITAVRKGETESFLDVAVKCSGVVEVGSRKAPFSGTATLSFSERIPFFALCANFVMPGRELGLLGSKGERIAATLYTASVSVLNIPGGKGGFVGTGATDDGHEIKDDVRSVD